MNLRTMGGGSKNLKPQTLLILESLKPCRSEQGTGTRHKSWITAASGEGEGRGAKFVWLTALLGILKANIQIRSAEGDQLPRSKGRQLGGIHL